MARFLVIAIVGALVGVAWIPAPTAAGNLAASFGPSPACLEVGLGPVHVSVDPATCWRIAWGNWCFILHIVAPRANCSDPIDW